MRIELLNLRGRSLRGICVAVAVLGAFSHAHSQTYTIGPDTSKAPAAKPSSPRKGAPAAQQQSEQLGFGSNIVGARVARAAELALQKGEYGLAVEYAQRAAQTSPNDAHLWFLLGYAARLNGKTTVSADAYGRGLKLIPNSVEGLSGLAQTYSRMGRTEDAIRLLKQVVASDSRRTDDSLLLGEMLMHSGDYNTALEYFRRAEQVQPATRSELLLALSYQHLKQFDTANRYLEMAKHRAPDNPEVQRSLAGYYLETGNYADAITALKSIRNAKPDVKAELAYTYQLAGKLVESADLYSQAANAVPKDLALQLSAAQAEVSIEAIDKANVFLKRAAGIDPEYYRLHAIRGEIARIQDRNTDAIEEYNKVLARLPESPSEGPLYGIQVHVDLMDLYQSVRNPDAAKEQLATAQKLISALDERGPGRVPFLRLRALIAMRSDRLDSAGKDLQEALAINPRDLNTLQLQGDLLVKMNKAEEAIAVYGKIIKIDPKNRSALIALGYSSRLAGHDREAEKYFEQLASAYPTFYVPYLALGDMYTARHDFDKAEASYTKAFKLAPKNSLIVAGGMNVDIEAHKLDRAAVWVSRVTPEMEQDPQVLREEERYSSFKGDYSQSAAIAERAIRVLPKDRDVVVYYGYDLLNLGRYDDLLKLTDQYTTVFPKEADLPLLAGYAHKHGGQLQEARTDFTLAIERDPGMVTAYVNRGYVLHDLRQGPAASADFEAALKLEPNNGEAHLGLAYASLDQHKPQIALRQSQLAEQIMGDSQPLHLIRATAYGQRGQLTKAANEYRAALKFTPNDGSLHLALAGTLYTQRKYRDSIVELNTAQSLTPNDATIYALLARAYAELQDKPNTLHYVQLAEQQARTDAQAKASVEPRADHQIDTTIASGLQSKNGVSGILLSTGSALNVIGDQAAAMQRFSEALQTPESDRVSIRLAIGQIMAQKDQADGARRQIALAVMESASGTTQPFTGEQYIGAADIFRAVHDYDLSQTYLEKARAAGALDSAVRIGMANNDLAVGDAVRAQADLAGISRDADSEPGYQYLLAQANVYRQEHQGPEALTAFSQASDSEGDDQTADQSLLQAGADEGLRVTPRISVLSDFSVEPIFEDSTVFVLDSKLDGPVPIPSTATTLLPPPRSSLQTQWTGAYHLHLDHLPTASGFFQVRNARGLISVPSLNSVVNRNTTDYSANFGLNPTVHLGRNAITFDSGVQGTIRRDSQEPTQLDQNLFRAFTYVTTTSFFNAVSASGSVIYETGPFTNINEHSRGYGGAIDFRVGAPWGKNALVTGWAANDQQFTPVGIENYYTSSYIGFERRFSNRLDIRAVAEDLRAWRVVGPNSGISQALRPAGEVNFAASRNWTVRGSVAYSSTRGFHIYDTVRSGASVSYAVPFHRNYRDETGEIPLQYPIRFSAGVQQEDFFNFQGGNPEQFRPYISVSLF